MWGIELQHPWMLLLIVPVILVFILKRRSWYWLGFNLLVVKKPHWLKRLIIFFGLLFLLAAFVSAVGALANPLKGEEEQLVKVKVHQACLALDVSGSMSDAVSSDNQEKRIVVATNAGKEFVSARAGDMFAVVPFNEKSRLGSSLAFTFDPTLVKNHLDTIANGAISGSTGIGEGIWTCLIFLVRTNASKNFRLDASELRRATENQTLGSYAMNTIREIGNMQHAFVIVLTDGENNTGIDPVRVLSLAARFGVKVYIIAATPQRFPDLARAIEMTGGKYFSAKNIAESKRFYSEINKLEKKELIIDRQVKHKSLRWDFMVASAIFFLTMNICNFVVLKVP